MLTEDDLLTLNTLPHINDVSLDLYRKFSINILCNRKFHYYFEDNTDIIVEFREWGIYHMLSIQHIDYTIRKNLFFQSIKDGLELNCFQATSAINARYRNQKERITMFACVYNALISGTVFYLPTGKVENTNNVLADYIIYHNLNGKGMNIGIRYETGAYIPLTILISKRNNPTVYINDDNIKIVKKLVVTDIQGNILLEKETNN